MTYGQRYTAVFDGYIDRTASGLQPVWSSLDKAFAVAGKPHNVTVENPGVYGKSWTGFEVVWGRLCFLSVETGNVKYAILLSTKESA
jgi:hypothetical protein